VVSAPGQYLAFYKKNELVKVFDIGVGEGSIVASSGNYVIYSGKLTNQTSMASINILNMNNWTIQNVIVGTPVLRNYVHSLAMKYISDDKLYILIGSPGHMVNQTEGLVSMLHGKLDNNTWIISEVYNKSMTNETLFGTSVAISSDGEFALIGSPQIFNTTNRHNERPLGYVHVLTNSGGDWNITKTINGKDHVFFDYFGLTVSLSENSTNILSIGALSFRGQLRVFIFKSNGTEWKRFTTQDTPLSLNIFPSSQWADNNLYETKNYSMALTDEVVVAGVTFYSDRLKNLNEGAVFLISTTTRPLHSWIIGLIGFGCLILTGFVIGIVYYFVNSADRRNRAYKEVI